MIIYKITNTVNGKVYIGQTSKSLNKRMSYHIRCAFNYGLDYALYRAFRKYGIDNFVWEEVCKCSNIDELNEKEVLYIDQYKSFNLNGYNMTSGGGGMIGYQHTDETKERLRESLKGVNAGKKNAMYGMSGEKSPTYGRKHTEETKQKMRELSTGCVPTEETRRKMSESGKGRVVSTETRLKLSETSSRVTYKITYPNGDVVIIKNLAKFCRDNNLLREGMRDTAKCRQNHHKGYKCEYYDGEALSKGGW